MISDAVVAILFISNLKCFITMFELEMKNFIHNGVTYTSLKYICEVYSIEKPDC